MGGLSREQIVARARQHVGHAEVSPNRSPLIDGWIAACGLDPDKGYPWCAAFASWCLGLERPIAGALSLGMQFPTTLYPLPGDLMFFATDNKGAGHVGIVVDVRRPEVLCIEGNSANSVRFVRRMMPDVLFSRTRDPNELGPGWAGAPLVKVEKVGTR
jgi:hypothetical protein